MKSPKFVGWAAVSSGVQAADDKISLADQIYANIMAARRHSGVMVCQFVIFGESRSITLFSDAVSSVQGCRLTDTFDGKESESLLQAIEKRLNDLRIHGEYLSPYAELKSMIDNRSFDVLTFRNLGRIGRDAALSMTVVRLCHNADIVTYATATPPQSLDDAHGHYHHALIDAITAVGYENEVREIKQRHQTGMIRRIRGGRFPGQTPWGWTEIRNAKGNITGYQIDEDAAATIRLMVRLYLEDGLSTRALADELNKRGHVAPTGIAWQKYSIDGILRKILRYAGINEINKLNSKRPYIAADGIWPAIISLDEAQAVEAERQSRAPHRRTVAFTHRLSRMVYCCHCGNLMHIHNVYRKWTVANGEERETKSTQLRCMEHGSVSEKKIMAHLHDAIDQIARIIKERGIYVEPQPQPDTTADEIASVQALIDRTQAGIERADSDYYVHSKISEERHRAITKAASDRIEQLMATITELQDRQRQEQTDNKRNERATEAANRGHEMLYHPNIKKSNAWLRRHFAVYASGGRVHAVKAI